MKLYSVLCGDLGGKAVRGRGRRSMADSRCCVAQAETAL